MDGNDYLTMDDSSNQHSAVTKENPIYFLTNMDEDDDTHV